MGGLAGPIGVGHGKTLLDLLTPMVVPNCKVAVLLLPTNLKPQLLENDLQFYGQHWKLPNIAGSRFFIPGRPTLHVVAYSELSGAKNTDLLSQLKPDTLILDEAHSLSNRTAARTKRYRRYVAANPGTRVFIWSGTLQKRSMTDWADLFNDALKEGSPAPLSYPVIQEWAGVIDPSEYPRPPGQLLKMCNVGETVEDAYQRRVLDTPGVVSSGDAGSSKCSLVVRRFETKLPSRLAVLLDELEETAERPDGEQLVDAISVNRCARQLAAGFYYKWRYPRKESPEVIDKWLRIRKEWHRELREELHGAREHLDSPLLLTKAAIRWHEGYVHIVRNEDGEAISRQVVPPFTKKGPQPVWASQWWPEWKLVRSSVEPETEAVWVDDFFVKRCVEWLREKPGLCWYEFSAFADAMRKAMPEAVFCGPGEEGAQRTLALSGTEKVIISIRANYQGKKLQMFHRNLVANPLSDGATWEQLIGRTDRQGQLAPEVSVEIPLHTKALRESLDTGRRLSQGIQQRFGIQQLLASKARFEIGEDAE